MKKIVVALIVLAFVASVVFSLTGTVRGENPANEKTLYACGMHPQVIQDHPGNCPICGMKLTPIRKQDNPDTNATMNSSVIAIDPATIQNMNLRTMEIARSPLRRAIRTVGDVTHSEAATVDVTTKFRGWVEKLFVDATGQQVHRGDPLFEIYSPELFSAQTEFLLALSSAASDDALRESTRLKLSYLDVSEAQIAELEKTRQPRKTLTVAAPIDGYVMEKTVVQGQMVEPGMKLYELVNHDTVWVLAKIYEQDLPLLRLGQEALVAVTSLPGAQFRGRVAFIYPTLDEKTRAATVRAEFHNPGHLLKPGMYATVQINAEVQASALLVPDSAVLRSGARNTVFVALGGGKFDPRTAVLGAEADGGMYQVISGLNEGERVVTSGQFMLDSESQLREAIEKMRGPANATAPELKTVAATNPMETAAPEKAAPESVTYVCPMPEHVSIIYDHAGNCPICNMTLVPVTAGELERLQPDGQLLYYTCPMPAHADVHEAKPGKCPRCGMTLIPVMTAPTNSSVLKTETNSVAKEIYFCPMHPTIVSNAPGKCPECEMDLVLKEK